MIVLAFIAAIATVGPRIVSGGGYQPKMPRDPNAGHNKTAAVIACALTLSAVACRPAPATRAGGLDVALPEECRGATVDLISSGSRTSLVLSRGGRVYVLDFIDGRLEGFEQLAGDTHPSIEDRGDLVCVAGELPEDECLRALWEQGACWLEEL